MTAPDGPLSPIGTLLKFLDPSYSPFAVATLAGVAASIFLADECGADQWWIIGIVLFLILLWCLVQARTSSIGTIHPSKRDKELGLPIALIALSAIAALVFVGTIDAKAGFTFFVVLAAAAFQLLAAHVISRLRRREFFLANSFHITQYSWCLCGLFAGFVIAAGLAASLSGINGESTERWVVTRGRLGHVGVGMAILWVLAVHKIFALIATKKTVTNIEA